MLNAFSALCLATALVLFVAWLGIVLRYAIPRAPSYFRWFLTPFMVGAVGAIIIISHVVRTGDDAVFLWWGAIGWANIFLACVFMTFLILDLYALWFRLKKGKRCPA